MATNEIEIDVTLNAKDAEKGLASLEEGSEALGETFSGVGKSISAIGGEMNERLGALGETFGGVAESVMGLSAAAKGSQASFLGMIGPIGLVAVALIEAYNAMETFIGTSKEREIKLKAYEISVAELTIALEELAAAQVTLTEAEIEELRVVTQSGKEKIEEAQNIREATTAIQEQIINIDLRIKRGRERLRQTQDQINANKQLAAGQYLLNQAERDFNQTIPRLLERRAKLEAKISKEHARANKLVAEGTQITTKSEAMREEFAKRSPKAIQERAKIESNMMTEARIKELQSQEQTERTKTAIAKLEAQRRFRELAQTQDVDQEILGRAAVAEYTALQYRLKQIAEEEAKSQRLKSKQAAALRKMTAAKRLAEEQQTQSELARIRRAEIENMRLLGGDRLEILQAQFDLELSLVGDNERAQEALRLEYANKRIVLEQEMDRKRQERERKAAEDARRLAEEEQRQADQRRAFIMESMEFDLEMENEGIDKELALLELKYRREMEIRGRSEEEITELTRRYNIERNRMIEADARQGMEALFRSLGSMYDSIQRSLGGVLFDSFTSVKIESREAFRALSDEYKAEQERIKESSEDAAFINQQMTELTANYARERANIRRDEEGAPGRMIGELLLALGKQASVEALMMTAKGIAATFTNPAAAGGYFAAAGIMGAAAATAGYAGTQLGAGSSSASGGSIAPKSPTDSPQSAPKAERERAERETMVFNINFGNSTIYDTKRAAQDAMASEILRTINRQRRGAPRFVMA